MISKSFGAEEGILLFVVFEDLTSHVVVKQQLFSLLDVSLCVEDYNISTLCHFYLRTHVIITVVAMVYKAGLVSQVSRVYGSFIAGEVIKIV